MTAGAPAGWVPTLAVDLGSGAGLPGLVLAVRFPSTCWVLVEAGERRAAFLRAAAETLSLGGRVEVVAERAEVVGRWRELRGQVDAVVARGFGRPAVVAECAAPLLVVGGRAVVSEPPGGDQGRWPEGGLARLGMALGPTVAAAGASYQVLLQAVVCDERYPRRTGVPGKRPLF